MSNMTLTTRTNAVPPSSGGGDTQLVSLTNCTASPILAGSHVWVKPCNGLTAYTAGMPLTENPAQAHFATNLDGTNLGLTTTKATSYVHKGTLNWGVNSATFTDTGPTYQYYYDVTSFDAGTTAYVYDTTGGVCDIYNSRYISASNMPFSWVSLPQYDGAKATGCNNTAEYLTFDNKGIVAYDKTTNTLDTSLVWTFAPTESMHYIRITPYHDDYFFVTYVTYDNNIMWNVLEHSVRLIKLNSTAESYTDLGEVTIVNNTSSGFIQFGVGHIAFSCSDLRSHSYNWHYAGGNYFILTSFPDSWNKPAIFFAKVDEANNTIDFTYTVAGLSDKTFFLDSSEDANKIPTVVINRATGLIYGGVIRRVYDSAEVDNLALTSFTARYDSATNSLEPIEIDWSNVGWWYKPLDKYAGSELNNELISLAIYGDCERFGVGVFSNYYSGSSLSYFFGYIKDIHGYAAMPYPVGRPNGQFVEAIAATDIQPNGTGSAYILAQQD